MADVERPLSPHLQVYRPQISSVLSIFHRGTGVVLAGGSVLLAIWLIAAAMGEKEFEFVQGLFGCWLGQLVLFGFTTALFYHLCNGIRHLFWDTGRGFELTTMNITGWLVLLVSSGLNVLAWIVGTWVAGYWTLEQIGLGGMI